MHQLFVTQIFQKNLPFDLKDLAKEIYQISLADQAGIKWSKKNYLNGFTSYGSWDQLNKMSSTFRELEKKIDRQVNTFSKSLDFDVPAHGLKMNNCWVNIMPAGSQHSAHLHPHSVISGTFYVDVPKGASSIKFEDPRLGLFMNSPVTKSAARKENLKFFTLAPKPGDIILFESWLKHEVPPNQSKKPRISVSFNYGWK
jgi:uncharacterized protein (TIGR02466 family)